MPTFVLSPEPVEPPFDFSKENIEQQFANAFIAALDCFDHSPIKVEEDHVLFWYAGKIFRIQISCILEVPDPVGESDSTFIKGE